MAIAKIILNGVVQMDVTQDIVAANNLLSGETATGADGEPVTGAYVPSGGGSEIESGTVQLVSSENSISVTFSGTHSSPPVLVSVCLDDHVQEYDSTTYTVYSYMFISTAGIVGGENYGGTGGSNPVFGQITRITRTNNSGMLNAGAVNVSTTPDFVSNTGFTATTNTSTNYWRAGAYKWIAVWKPAP